MAAIGNGYYSNRSDNSFVYGGSSTKEYPFRLGSTSVSLGLLNAAKGLYVGTSPIYHPEAINWVNRAQANVGTISTETLGAVSAFCYAIDAANLRDKFLIFSSFDIPVAALLISKFFGKKTNLSFVVFQVYYNIFENF